MARLLSPDEFSRGLSSFPSTPLWTTPADVVGLQKKNGSFCILEYQVQSCVFDIHLFSEHDNSLEVNHYPNGRHFPCKTVALLKGLLKGLIWIYAFLSAVRRWRGLASEVGRPTRSRPRKRAQTQRLQAGQMDSAL